MVYIVRIRFFLVCVALHAWTAFSLISENRKVRPRSREVEVTKKLVGRPFTWG